MKRSQINALIKDTMAWLEEKNVYLPPFAYWSPSEWASKGHEYDEIRKNMLGWDVTDYGRGDFNKVGLLLFTIRNGNLNNPEYAKPYAEKMLISQVEQLSPNHFHWYKMEDIINRGGGTLLLQLWNSTTGEGLADTEVTVRIDGKVHTVPAGGEVFLKPGESITITPGIYHLFTAKDEKVLAWEVSMVNDDNTDNRFYETQERFTYIEEDEPAEFLLCNEYPEAE
ncbi:D-lyxose/D-mannose family sugar isomerase [Sinanaerobacter chloroacetimidivorans]|jgi:D-lyxose ketol-isomerase|uniref:D-lyxose ketol-isomerase n=1 Tax=Sinanaerobacter chloroacetimidivorans TaxID=2818044 RepID=A0A8J8B2I2_9FIRM|nr:D-lyxose/D-mannose family sugar isomerase [Sinanaerobacter chloroacetimidivorans]MBR0599843.1 D-lyxose/D-mannose family sugar isomerase [Sinanaerobacter chloroacetimidivorans]